MEKSSTTEEYIVKHFHNVIGRASIMASARDIVLAEDVILVPNVLTDTVMTEGTDDNCKVEVGLDSRTLDVSLSSVSTSSSSSVSSSSTDIDTSNSNDGQGMFSELGEEIMKTQDAMMVPQDAPMVDVEYVSSEGEEVCREIPVDAILEDEDDVYEKSRSVVKNSALMFAINIDDSSGTDKRPRVKCILCGQKMLRKSIRGHIETIHSNGKTKVKCDVCGKEMLNNNLPTHKMTHSNGRTKVKCDVCGKEIFNSNLPRHKMTHSIGKTKGKCDVCGKEMLNTNLPRHKMTHSKQPREEQNRDRERFEVCCLRCGKIVEKNSLAAHVRNVHVNTEKIQCNVCGVRVKRKSLKPHQLIHSKNRKVPCDICGSQMLKLSLKKHMADVHSNDNHVSCQFCGSIMLRSSLMNHVRNNCAAANR